MIKNSKINRLGPLAALAAVFIIPWVIAIYFWAEKRAPSRSSSAHGQLLKPMASVDHMGLRNQAGRTLNWHSPPRWHLVYIKPAKCAWQCRQWLRQLRQIHIATGKYQSQVQRDLVLRSNQTQGTAQQLLKKYPAMNLWFLPKRASPSKERQRVMRPGHVVLVDPEGYGIMLYKPQADPKGVLKDLEHVLKLSANHRARL